MLVYTVCKMKQKTSRKGIVHEVEELVLPHKMLRLSARSFAIILIITGLVGLAASFVLTVDKIHVLRDPSFDPSCNINPVLSCGSVMKSSQAEIRGIPNTIFGLIGFSGVITTGVTLLAGAKLHRRFWQAWMVGMGAGLVMMLYLMFQSIFRLGNLCIYCMATWASLIPLIWYSVLWSLQHEFIPVLPRAETFVRFIRREHLAIIILIYFAIITLLVHHFWYYIRTL